MAMLLWVPAEAMGSEIFADGFEGELDCFVPANYDPQAHSSLSRSLQVTPSNTLFEASLDVTEVTPTATDWLYQHLVALDTQVSSRGQLAVYLMGAADRGPEGTEAITTATMASYGFHALTMSYPQSYGIADGCAETDVKCKGRKRLEAFDGLNYSSLIEIPRANSLEQRLVDVLNHLQQLHPDGDWGYFLTVDGQVDFRKVVLAGQSHGASSAALIGRIRPLARVVLMSGPGDHVAGEPAGWICGSSLTASDSYFAFNHVNDVNYDTFLINNRALELDDFGASANVDLFPPPYADSHMLVATREIVDNPSEPDHVNLEQRRAHACTRPGGHPTCTTRYQDVYRYIFGSSAGP